VYECFQLYDEADMQEEKVRIAQLLGAAKDEKLIARTLEFAMSVSCRSKNCFFFNVIENIAYQEGTIIFRHDM